MTSDQHSEDRDAERDLYIAIVDHALSDSEDRDLVELIRLVLVPATPEEKLSRWIRDAI